MLVDYVQFMVKEIFQIIFQLHNEITRINLNQLFHILRYLSFLKCFRISYVGGDVFPLSVDNLNTIIKFLVFKSFIFTSCTFSGKTLFAISIATNYIKQILMFCYRYNFGLE